MGSLSWGESTADRRPCCWSESLWRETLLYLCRLVYACPSNVSSQGPLQEKTQIDLLWIHQLGIMVELSCRAQISMGKSWCWVSEMVWLRLPMISFSCHQSGPLKSAGDPVEFFLLWGFWLPSWGWHHARSLQNLWPLPDHRKWHFGQELVELLELLSGRH